MPNAEGSGTSALSEDRDDLHRAIVSDLVSLIESVQAGMNLIEAAIAGESPLGYQEMATNIVVLDDVTPRYVRARAALSSCDAHLGAALRFLLDTRTPQPGTSETDCTRQPARSTGRA
jgi:hypothetical protein